MESELLQFIGVFIVGMVTGVLIMLLVNKIRSGSASPKNVQQEYDQYQAEVERHFEETSKKFKNMTEQYQDIYQHLSIGATSLCRPESAAAALADQRSPMDKTVKLAEVSDNKHESKTAAKPADQTSKPSSSQKSTPLGGASASRDKSANKGKAADKKTTPAPKR